MPVRAQALTSMHFFASDSDGPKTGETYSTITLKIIKDGTVSAVAGTLQEVDATNAPGIYKVAITAAENTADVCTLCGKSTTSGVTVSPVTWTNITNADANVAAILVDTGTTLDGKINTIDGIVDDILVDTGTTLPGTLTSINTAVAANNTLLIAVDNIVDDILVDTAALSEPVDCNVTQIAGSASAATSLSSGSAAVETGAVHNSTAPTASSFLSDTGALSSVDDVYNNRLLLITSGAIAGAVAEIADYTGSTKTFVFTSALPAAPANDVTFMII